MLNCEKIVNANCIEWKCSLFNSHCSYKNTGGCGGGGGSPTRLPGRLRELRLLRPSSLRWAVVASGVATGDTRAYSPATYPGQPNAAFWGIAWFVRAPATGALDATTRSRCRRRRRRRRRRTGRPGLGHRPQPGAGAQGRPTVQAVPVPVGGPQTQIQGRNAEQGGNGHVSQQVSPSDCIPIISVFDFETIRCSRYFTDRKMCKSLTIFLAKHVNNKEYIT